jgi:EpsI family protein
MEEFGQRVVPGVNVGGQALVVNRSVIRHGDSAQLVYYWFQQRGRVVTNEYLVKWYIFVDSLLRNRTDGALVRLVTPLAPGEDTALADRRLAEFAGSVSALLPAYVPN